MLVRGVQVCLNFREEPTQCARNVRGRPGVRIAQELGKRDTQDTVRWGTELAVLFAPAQVCAVSAAAKDTSNWMPSSGQGPYWAQQLRCTLPRRSFG